MMIFDIFGKGELHEYYPLKEPMLVNNQLFSVIDIWQHYKIKHSHCINDNDILQLVKQLHQTNYPPKSEGYLNKNNYGTKWRSYQQDKFYINHKAYRLIWYIEDDNDTLTIVHCLRRDQYDKKEK